MCALDTFVMNTKSYLFLTLTKPKIGSLFQDLHFALQKLYSQWSKMDEKMDKIKQNVIEKIRQK